MFDRRTRSERAPLRIASIDASIRNLVNRIIRIAAENEHPRA